MSEGSFRPIVFDLDDTLYPERIYALSGLRAAGAWLELATGLEGLAGRAIAEFESGRRGDIFDRILLESARGHDPELIARAVEVYRTHTPVLEPYEDAVWALEHYRGMVPLGLITDGYLVAQQAKVSALGLEGVLTEIVYTAELGRAHWKPDPRSFREIAVALLARDQRGADRPCVYVADNVEKDFVAPNRLGWLSVQISRPGGEYASREPADGGMPHHVIASLRKLPEILGF